MVVVPIKATVDVTPETLLPNVTDLVEPDDPQDPIVIVAVFPVVVFPLPISAVTLFTVLAIATVPVDERDQLVHTEKLLPVVTTPRFDIERRLVLNAPPLIELRI